MPIDPVTYHSSRASAEIIAMLSAATPDDEMGLYRLFGGRARYVSRIRENGFSVYRARVVNRMPATLNARVEAAPDDGSTVVTWFEPKPGWRDLALGAALALSVCIVPGWQGPAYLAPTVIALLILLITVHKGFRRRWDRDRAAAREFVTSLLQ